MCVLKYSKSHKSTTEITIDVSR